MNIWKIVTLLLLVAALSLGLLAQDASVLLKQAQQAYAKHNYNDSLQLLQQIKNKDAKQFGEEAQLLEANCYFATQNFWNVISGLEDKIDGFQNEERKLQGQVLLTRTYKQYNSQMSLRQMRHYEILYAKFNAAFKKNGAKKQELLELLFDYQEVIGKYWNYNAENSRWQEEFNKTPPAHRDWYLYFQEKCLEVDERRLQTMFDLLAYIEVVAGKDSHDTARARYAKACYYVNEMPDRYRRVNYYTPGQLSEAIRQSLDKGIEIFRQIPPGDDLGDDGLYLAAYTIHQKKNDLPQAVAAYEALLEKFPDGKWASDARHHLQEIRREEIGISVPRAFHAKETIKLNLQARNIGKIAFDLRRVVLMKDRPGSGENYDTLAKRLAEAAPALKTWEYETGIAQDHIGVSKEIELPNLGYGLYVLSATGKTRRTQVIVVVSDIVMVNRQAQEKLLTYIVDGVTGKPVAKAQVSHRLSLYYPNSGYRYENVTGQTNADGLWVLSLYPYGRPSSYSSDSVAEAAGQYAVVTNSYSDYQSYQNQTQVLGYTNQPAYRPGQKVEFKLIFRGRQNGAMVNLKNKMVVLYIQDPLGTKAYDRTLFTNNYGTVSDSFTLDDKARLGVYSIIASIDGQNIYQDNYAYPTFRVEEYKKPEFQVTVAAVGEGASFGEEVSFTIHGEYYFGGPVAGGMVSYTIYTQPHYAQYTPAREYDWYYETPNRYGKRGRGREDYYGYGRSYVTSVQNQPLDSEGNHQGKFTAQPTYGEGVDQIYLIEAQVVDKSRRMIQGQGTIYVTHKGFAVFLAPKKDLYLKGETVQIEIVAKTANGNPVACQGEAMVAIDRYQDGQNVWQELSRQKIATDSGGKALLSFIADEEGYFRITFKAHDAKKREVSDDCSLWIISKEFRGDHSKFSNVEMVADKAVYSIGETVNILLTCHLPDSFALISVIGDQSLIQEKTVALKGKCGVFTLPITPACAPNIFVHALVVKGHQIYQHTLSLTVPPLQYFTNLKVASDKATYLPGQKAKIKVSAKDYLGKPLVTELSLGAVDASLYYIQPDITPDIRKFFYGKLRENRLNFRSSLEFSYSSSGELLPGYNESYFECHSLPGSYENSQYQFEYLPRKDEIKKAAASRNSRDSQEVMPQEEDADLSRKVGESRHDSFREESKSEDRPMPIEHAKKEMESPPESKSSMAKDMAPSPPSTVSPEPQFKEAKVRTVFKDNCFWAGQLVTDKNGEASVEIELPDNLTTWTLTSRSIDLASRVGVEQQSIITQKEVLIRPQQPRFFRERDLVTLSAIVQNNLSDTLEAKVILTIDDKLLTLAPVAANQKERRIKIRGKKDYRVDWVVKVQGEGQAKIKMAALTTADSDAVEQSFPVYRHGIEKYILQTGVMMGDNNKVAGDLTHTLTIQVPKERILDSTMIELTFSPTMASAIMEALPYLVSYPYGCVEQTMSRFLPSVLTAKTLKGLGISLEEIIRQRQLPLVQGDTLHPTACLSDAVLRDMIEKGKQRLYDFQHGDGGWGWWKNDPTNLYMTSYVLFGLNQARQAGVDIDSNRIYQAGQFVWRQFDALHLEEDRQLGNHIDGNRLAYMLYSLSSLPEMKNRILELKKAKMKKGRGVLGAMYFLLEERDLLNDYGRSLLALSFANLGERKEAEAIVGQIVDTAISDRDNDTTYWGYTSGYYYWYQDGIETTAYALKALVAADPHHPYLSKAAKWLMLKRQGIRWKSTKDTAMAIYGLLDYLKLTGEMQPDYAVKVRMDQQELRSLTVNRKNLFTLDNKIVIRGKEIQDGTHKLLLEKRGQGNLYYSVALKYFTLEEDITPEKTEAEISRQFYQVTVANGQETKRPIAAGVTLKSGDLVDVVLQVKLTRDCEYLLIEDYKAAGCEALELTSGSDGYVAHREMRDALVAFFISYLPKGGYTFTYRLRAEIPGEFHAMPAMLQGMYTPHIRANSAEWRVNINDE